MKCKRLHPDTKLPTRAYEGDLGFDLYALEDVVIPTVNENGGIPVVKVRTGIAVELPRGWGAFIKDRSSVATRRLLHVVAGVIDNGYRGEIIVALANLSGREQRIEKGEKIAQLVPVPVSDFQVIEVEELTETNRGEGGFGSSGNK
ncbi:dUTP pyrophosphatase [Balnearium lithotrophicum]|uniref:dUTP diphosphatase n=1 Tax=Balnearium lithotrophicum TaxID=223788 RepID=A0A521CNZ8_9BACT|nr:dUTP diphosphatase [Balnearium lithotrophicum]SMO61177.1 dUTP pyrophosphatase [Balnearium lithotrophicum]